MLRLLLAAALVALVAAAPLKVETADDFNAALAASHNVKPVSFLQTAPAEPSSAAAAATPFYDPLMLGMMGFYPFMGYYPFYTPFFNPYFSWWGGYGWWY